MKLSTKLGVSFFVVVIFVGGIGLVSSYFNDIIKDQVTIESKQAIQEVKLAGELGLQLFRSLTRTQYLLEDGYRKSLGIEYSRGNRTEEVQIERINHSLDEFRDALKSIRTLVKKESGIFLEHPVDSIQVLTRINDLESKFENYASLLRQFQSMGEDNSEDRKVFFTVTIEPYFRTSLIPAIEELRNRIQSSHQQQIGFLNSQLDRASYILIIVTLAALTVALLLAFYTYRSIANPIAKIADAAERIGKGDLKERINYTANDELGQLSQTFDRMAENLNRTTVSRDYVDSIIEAMADLLLVTDKDLKITRLNSAAVQILDRSELELKKSQIDQIFENTSQEIFNQQKETDRKIFTGYVRGLQEKKIPVSISKGTINDREGEVQGYVFVASDISSQKKAQQQITESLREKEILLAEIHHRVKNNLAVISGLLQMQMWESDNEGAQSALKQSHLRVQSIALVHEKLYQSDSLSYIEFDQYLHDLLDTITDGYLDDDTAIKIFADVKNITLNINQAIPSALLINELVINAIKHSLCDTEDGIINITVECSGSRVVVTVKDNGKGLQKEGDGVFPDLDLVNTLVAQLNGQLDYYSDDRTHVKVSYTAEEVSKV